MPVLFDGYNLLRSIQKNDEQFHALTEVGLCRILSEYLMKNRNHGHMFFDGVGPKDQTDMERLGGFNNMEVYFSGHDRDADSAIEQKILDSTAPKRLIVVSTDRRLRAAAGKRKAISVTSEIFWASLMNQFDNQRAPTPEPREKRSGITSAETDQWLEYFDIEP